LKFDIIYSEINTNLTKLPDLYKILGIYFHKKHDKMVEEITRRPFFLLFKFLDEKNYKRKKWNLIMEVRRVQGGFFPKFGRNVIIFVSRKFRASNFIFPVGSEQRRGGSKSETERVNNSHFELEFE
jgi:hypothetical protein